MRVVPTKRIELRRHNKPKKPKQYDGNVRRLLAKESSKRKKLEALGIDYDFPGYVRIPFYSPLPPDCNCIHSPSHHRRYKYVQRENMLSLIEFHKYIALFSKRVCCQLHDGRPKSPVKLLCVCWIDPKAPCASGSRYIQDPLRLPRAGCRPSASNSHSASGVWCRDKLLLKEINQRRRDKAAIMAGHFRSLIINPSQVRSEWCQR